IPRSLAELGFPVGPAHEAAVAVVVDEVLASPPPSARPLDRAGLTALVSAASAPAAPRDRSGAVKGLRAPETIEHQSGFNSTHESEALPGALPRNQNAPRPAPYGLYPELLNGTPFTTKNAL